MTQAVPPIERVPLEVPGTGPIVNCKGCGTHFAQGSATQVYCPHCLGRINLLRRGP